MDRTLDQKLSMLIEEIERTERTKQRFGSAMNQLKHQIDLGSYPALSLDSLESCFTKQVHPTRLDGLRIAGIDGGLARRHFKSMELILTRAVGVIFQFQKEQSPLVDFFPAPFPEPNLELVLLSLSGQELDQLASLTRIAEEIRVAISIIDEFHVDIVLLDGSLIYHPRDRPPAGTPAETQFQEVLALYRQLYHKISRSRTMLVGIVKDTRSSRITNMLGDILPHLLRDPEAFEIMQGIDYRWLVKISRDSDILDTFLDEGERTFVFRYANELRPNSQTLHADLLPWAESILVTYLKTAKNDLPIRVELLTTSEGKNASNKMDKALSAILPLSNQHPEFGLPSPILEADARARISHKETKMVVDRLLALSGLTYPQIEQRRGRNPFGG